MRSVTK